MCLVSSPSLLPNRAELLQRESWHLRERGQMRLAEPRGWQLPLSVSPGLSGQELRDTRRFSADIGGATTHYAASAPAAAGRRCA